ncbi:MAG TPA: hypothetical protein VIB62_00030 [Actinomycetota bacterium]
MWVFPLVAALVAFVFAWAFGRQFLERRRPYQLIWGVALVLYGAASLAVTIGAIAGWTSFLFELYWAFGAVLTVPFLAAGEVLLLARGRVVAWAAWLVLIFLAGYTFAVLAGASYHALALAEQLPSGKEVFGDGTAAHRLPQLISIPSYLVLVGGALWSAWTMRGHRELRDRFIGTLLVALGATITAVGGSAFAALGRLVLFSMTLLAGVAVMFWGFLRASRRAPAAAPAP